MTTGPLAAARFHARSALRATTLLTVVMMVSACSLDPAPRTLSPSPSVRPTTTPPATPRPTPTPQPTPQYTNPADPALAAVLPDEIGGVDLVKPPIDEFGLTPGDIGEVYGAIGIRFLALQVAYVERPRLSLYAMRMSPPVARTEDLEPHLAEAGRYVGIAGLHREPWHLETVGQRVTWVRPEDNATAAGTMVYTWAADGFVFLLIGVDDALNRALLALLPGQPPPTPSPAAASPSASPESTVPAPTPAASGG